MEIIVEQSNKEFLEMCKIKEVNEEEARIIFKLNEKDSTVAEIINNLFEIIKTRQSNQTS